MSEELKKNEDELVNSEAELAKNEAESETVGEEADVTPKPDSLEEIYDENGIRLDLKINQRDMYAFLMYHSYCSVAGLIAGILSVFCLVKGISEMIAGTNTSMTAILLVIGLWFLVVNPLSMRGKAAVQLKSSPVFKEPITYMFTEKGMLQEQGETRTGCKWHMITKVVYLKRIWILYAGKVRASVLPVAQLGEQKEELRELIQKHTGKKR